MTKNKKNSNIPEVNDNELEIRPPSSDIVIESEDDQENSSVSIKKEGVNVKKHGNLVVGNVNLILNPIKKRNFEYYKENIWRLITDIFLLLLIITLVIFLFFVNRKIKSNDIVLNVSGDYESLSAGSLASFKLDYKTKINSTNNSINISLPENFVIESVSPNNIFNSSTKTFNLGDLEKNSVGQIKINGWVWGDINDRQTVTFNYNCDQCGSDGIKDYLFYSLEKPIIDLSIISDNDIYVGSEFDGIIKITNNSDILINEATIDFDDNINIKKSDLDIKDEVLVIKNLAANETRDINFSAIINNEGTVNICSQIKTDIDGNSYSFSTSNSSFNVKKTKFIVSLSNNKNSVNLSDSISYKLDYKNEETATVKNIKISLVSANPNFSITSLKVNGDFKNAEINNNVITIHDLLSGEGDSISIDVKYDQRKIRANQSLSLEANTEYQIDGQDIKYSSYSENNKLISHVSATAKAYYYSPQGDQLGVGPLPPAVDMATSYWIFLEFNNNGNDLTNFSLTAELPDNVYFADEKRVLDGKIIYGEIGKRIIWEIADMSGGNNKYQANFKVNLIPDSKDYGTTPNLLTDIKYTVKDDFVNQELSGSLQNVNTNLINDKLSSGKGKVIRLN